MPRMRPLSFFSCHAVRNAARSMVRSRERIPTSWSWPRMASPFEKYGHEAQARGALELVGRGAGEEIREIHLAVLESGQSRGLLGHGAHDQALDVRGLAPVALEGLEHQLDAGLEARDLVGPGTHRRLLEAVVADLLDVLPGHDPARAGGRGAVEGHEIGPGLLQVEAHPSRIHHLDLAHAVLEQLGGGALVAVEAELDVVRRDGLA